MVAKKKKSIGKKSAQKAIKKGAKIINKKASPKKVAKKAAKKTVTKKTAKQAVQKSKAVKQSKVNSTKKLTKKSAGGKSATAKSVKQTTSSVKKVKQVQQVKQAKQVKKPVKKSAETVSVKQSAPEKTNAMVKPVVRSQVTQPEMKPSKSKQQDIKKQTMIEQSKKKMTEKMDHASTDEMVATESTEVMSRKKPTTLLGALEFTPYQPKADEAYMNDHQREHFRKILDAWKQQLMQDVDLTVGHLKEDAVFYADPVDRAAQEEGFNLELRTRDRERKLIKKIEQSLDLLNTGEYGYCEDCGAEIGIRRLEARPTAVKCIDCKTFQEIREKQLGG